MWFSLTIRIISASRKRLSTLFCNKCRVLNRSLLNKKANKKVVMSDTESDHEKEDMGELQETDDDMAEDDD